MASKKTHILILPYPAQGHINPMLQFAKRLVSKSPEFILTLLIPTSQVKSMTPRIGSINVLPISDGVHDGQKFESVQAYLKQFQRAVPGSLDELIRGELDESHPKILIYDSFLPWALDVAHVNGVAGAPFFTQTCSVSAIYLFYKQGKLKSSSMESLIGLPRLEERDLPSFIQDKESLSTSPLLEMLVDQFLNLDKADFVFFNTFDKLEPQMVEWMASQWPILTIGPAIPSMYLDKYIEDDKSYGLNLFKPDGQAYQDWLSEKRACSVIYVSFGSMAILEEDQVNEIAQCLENLQTHFIWVVRETEMSKLPSKFVEWNSRSGSSGLVVTWCNQLDVLANEAVGCFVTHCGWNSTLEALCFGVPMVGMPKWSDQPTNAKFVEDVWRVGLRAKEDENGIVSGLEMERCVRAVLEEGDEIRRNAEKMKNWALEAIKIGGSSDCNIAKFVSGLA